MMYSRWTSNNEMKKYLSEINVKGGVEKSGIAIMNEGDNLYIDNKEAHTLVIGSTGSGKTQSIVLPTIKLAIKAGESIVINDVKGDIFERTSNAFEEKGYKNIVINFEDSALGNSWNPLDLPYSLYKEGKMDQALTQIEDIAYYLFYDPKEKIVDNFWLNSIIDYFTGITLYLFANAKEDEINLTSVYNLGNDINILHQEEKILKQLDKNSNIYIYLSSILNSPKETFGSIVSYFSQKFKRYICREELSNMLAKTDFDLSKICEEKTAIFVVSGNATYSGNLIPLLVNQIINSANIKQNNKRINIILDEFDSMLPIKNFAKIINYSRSINIRFIVVIKSYLDLINIYGKEDYETIKLCFSNTIYLHSDNIYTLEEISNSCGISSTEKGKDIPLISIQELKLLKAFEAVILVPRMYPFKTTLLPDYKIDWGFNTKEKQIPKRKTNEYKIYSLDK